MALHAHKQAKYTRIRHLRKTKQVNSGLCEKKKKSSSFYGYEVRNRFGLRVPIVENIHENIFNMQSQITHATKKTRQYHGRTWDTHLHIIP